MIAIAQRVASGIEELTGVLSDPGAIEFTRVIAMDKGREESLLVNLEEPSFNISRHPGCKQTAQLLRLERKRSEAFRDLLRHERLNSCRPDEGAMCIGLCRGSRGPGSRHSRGDLKQRATGNHTHETPFRSGFRWCGRGRSAPGRIESRQTSHRA